MEISICHVTSMHEWHDDRIYQRACIGLAKNGTQVTLIAPSGTAENDPERDISEHELKNSLKFIGLKRRSGISRRILTSFDATRMVLRTDCHVVHFHDPDLLPWMVLLKWFTSRKVIYDIHENYSARILNLNVSTSIRKILLAWFRKFERYTIANLDGYTTTTESMRKIYKDLNKPSMVIGNVPYLARIKKISGNLSPKYENITIVTSGTHSSARNCMQTIEAIPAVVQKHRNVKFCFYGRYSPPEFKQSLISRARDLGVSEYVVIEGMLPWLENFKRVAKAHIGCVFYEDNINNQVTLPNRLFEYMAMGLAVVGEDFPEVRKILNNSQCGMLVHSNDPKSISQSLILLIEADILQYGKNAREAVLSHYNFDKTLKQMNIFYRKIMASN